MNQLDGNPLILDTANVGVLTARALSVSVVKWICPNDVIVIGQVVQLLDASGKEKWSGVATGVCHVDVLRFDGAPQSWQGLELRLFPGPGGGSNLGKVYIYA